eukprot:4015232-Prymnesium_polylepis.1
MVICTTRPSISRRTRPLVVLVHGFLGDRRDVEPLRCAISALGSFDCVSVDLPWHGDSARLASNTRQAVDALWSEVCALGVE